MWLVVVGVITLGLKLTGLFGAAAWSWWLVLAPFGAAALWWQIADSAGWTQRAAMRRQEVRVQRRRDERMDALGLRRTPQRGSADKDPTQQQAGRGDARDDSRNDSRNDNRSETRQDPSKRPPEA